MKGQIMDKLEYFCTKCGWTIRDKQRSFGEPVKLVKLWREYNTILDAQTFYCKDCALAEAGLSRSMEFIQGHTTLIGDLVPACPTELPNASGRFSRDATFWGMSSTPDWSFKWWLDLSPGIPQKIDTSKFETREQTEARKQREREEDDDWTERMVRETAYLVSASHFETHQMWCNWHSVLDLKQVSRGLMERVGKLGKHEVWVCLYWYYIEGKLVGFYEGSGQVVDHELIKRWTKKRFPCMNRPPQINHCNMWNFGHCVNQVAPNWSDDPKKKAQWDAINKVLHHAGGAK